MDQHPVISSVPRPVRLRDRGRDEAERRWVAS